MQSSRLDRKVDTTQLMLHKKRWRPSVTSHLLLYQAAPWFPRIPPLVEETEVSSQDRVYWRGETCALEVPFRK
jgi:hypothetical protein